MKFSCKSGIIFSNRTHRSCIADRCPTVKKEYRGKVAKKKYNSDFDIPGIIIFLAFVFCWPLGIALTVLKMILQDKAKKNKAENPYYRAEDARYNTGKRQSATKRSKAGTVTKILGIVSLILAALTAVGTIGSASGIYDAFAGMFWATTPFILSAAGLFAASSVLEKRDSRYARIRAIIGDRDSLNLDKLVAASGSSVKKVSRDLQKMIDGGEFGSSAYIDLGANNFMRTPYAQPDDPPSFDYTNLYGDTLKKNKKKDKRKSEEEAVPPTEEKSTDNDNFDKIIRDIRRLNDEIKDISVSERIDSIELHTKNIFEYVTDHPEAMSQIRTFMNYYLPTTLKLLESYSRIERVGVAGENMKKSKENIESILDLLVVGFEQQVDQLFKNESIDISSDISVLETMMQKDGLGGKNPFDIRSYTDSYSDEISDDIGGGASAAAPLDK